MALVILGGGVAEARGSVGGITFSRNRGGAYMRNRTVPTDPGTVQQQAIRTYMATLANLWVNYLTAAQRALWDAYADAVHLPNALGQARNVGGIGMYCRSNVPNLQWGHTRIDDAPIIFDTGEYTAPAIASITAATDVLSLTFQAEDAWAGETDSAMLVYVSRPMNATRNYFKGPYRYAAAVEGDDTLPPVSPQAIDLPFPVEVGHKVFVQVRVLRADGRLSSPFRTASVAV